MSLLILLFGLSLVALVVYGSYRAIQALQGMDKRSRLIAKRDRKLRELDYALSRKRAVKDMGLYATRWDGVIYNLRHDIGDLNHRIDDLEVRDAEQRSIQG